MSKKLKLLFALCAFVALSLGFLMPVKADFATAYQDYVFNVQQYKTAYNEFQIARSTYQTYKTLTAQNDATQKFKNVLKARNNVVSSYYDLLQERMNAEPGVANEAKTTFGAIKESEKSFLSANQTQIDAAGSLGDLNEINADFKEHYPQIDKETKQTVGTILVAKENSLRDKLNLEIGNVSTKLSAIKADGEDTSATERGLIEIQNKLNFQTAKTQAAQKIFSGEEKFSTRNQINLLDGQKALIEANQYLKEAASFLLEIVKSYTG